VRWGGLTNFYINWQGWGGGGGGILLEKKTKGGLNRTKLLKYLISLDFCYISNSLDSELSLDNLRLTDFEVTITGFLVLNFSLSGVQSRKSSSGGICFRGDGFLKGGGCLVGGDCLDSGGCFNGEG